MIQEFVDRFIAAQPQLREQYRLAAPKSYSDIVKDVITLVADPEGYADTPDPNRITCINHGDYQGTLLFVVAATGYQPWKFWSVLVSYGSCSGCDTFEAIGYHYDDGPTPESMVDDYMTLALHICQGISVIGGELAY